VDSVHRSELLRSPLQVKEHATVTEKANEGSAKTERRLALESAEQESEERPNLDCHALRHVFGSAMVKATNGVAERVPRLDRSQRHEDAPPLLLT
jgi:hypothetical protein